MTDPVEEILGEIEWRIDHTEMGIEEGKTAHDEPDCPHCGREMSFGKSTASGVKYGCYPPTGEGKAARENYDCPYYQENGLAFTVEKKTRDVNALKRSLLELRGIKREVEKHLEEPVGADSE